MKEYRCHIDDFKYRKYDDQKKVIIYGWAFNKNGQDFDYEIQINGKETKYEFVPINRGDVKKKFSKYCKNSFCGFRMIIDCQEYANVESVKLYAIKDSKKYLLKEWKAVIIDQFMDTRSIIVRIDSFMKNHGGPGKYVISGWAVSLLGDALKYDLVDENGNSIDHTLSITKRSDLVKFKILSEEQQYAGFTFNFNGQPNKKYYVSITNKKETIEEEANKVIMTKYKKAKLKTKHYVSLIKPVNFVKAGRYVKRHGVKGLVRRLRQGPGGFGIPYDEWFNNHKVTTQELEKQKQVHFEYAPKISVIVPTYNTPEKFLKEMVESLLNQSYANWELCIADGSDASHPARKMIEDYTKQDKRIVACYLDENYGISGNTNKALELATGDYVGLFDHDDLLTPDCLFEVVQSLQEEKHDIIYTDEDKLNNALGKFEDPNFKPDFSPDLFYSHNYITHFFVVKREIIVGVGGFRSEFDGAQDYDVMFRCIEKANHVHHIPKILYHWRMHAASTAENPESKLYCYEAGRKAVEEHYQRVGIKAKVEQMPKPLWGMYHSIYETLGNPQVSIVIPNKDQKDTLKTCLDSLYNVNTYTNFEVVIVENNSTTKEIFEYYDSIQKEHSNIKVVTYKGDFNYSAINNYGVTFASGDYLLFLNNDTEMINPNSLSEMLGCCMRDEVGIVGAKLLYEDDTVQHGGVVIGFGGFAGHVFTGINKDDYGYMVRARINCNYSAVTAACMLVKKECFDQVHGFSEEFKVGLNDIDFCLKVRELDKLVVFNAHALWHHYESKSRGYEDTIEKQKRFEGEIRLFQSKWKDILQNGDPYYNKNFVIEHGPFILS